MHKEMVICVVFVIFIIIGDIVTQKYTKNTVNYMTNELEILKNGLLEQSKEEINDEIDKIDRKWKDAHNKLAYYIEHDELEKVETNFTACRSLANNGEYSQAISEVEKTIYVLDHITDKYSFNLVNIF